MADMDHVIIMDHPLIKHKISMLRDIHTGTNEFRTLVGEIAMLEAFEALRDLPMENREVETPLEKAMVPYISGKKMAIVPILRAGLGMVDGVLTLVPTAKVGHIGLYRDPKTHEPHEYYCKLPSDVGERLFIVVDPMLATGGSSVPLISLSSTGGRRSSSCAFWQLPRGSSACMKRILTCRFMSAA